MRDRSGRQCAGCNVSGVRRISFLSRSVCRFTGRQPGVQGHQFFKIYDELQVEYVLVAKGSSDDVYMIGKMAAFQIQNLLVAYKERFDKDNFIKNLLLDNLLLVDIYNRAKKLHIAANARRVVFLVDTAQEKDNASMECIRSLLGTKTGDFITAVDEKSIIVVKELLPKKVIRKWRKRQSRF